MSEWVSEWSVTFLSYPNWLMKISLSPQTQKESISQLGSSRTCTQTHTELVSERERERKESFYLDFFSLLLRHFRPFLSLFPESLQSFFPRRWSWILSAVTTSRPTLLLGDNDDDFDLHASFSSMPMIPISGRWWYKGRLAASVIYYVRIVCTYNNTLCRRKSECYKPRRCFFLSSVRPSYVWLTARGFFSFEIMIFVFLFSFYFARGSIRTI